MMVLPLTPTPIPDATLALMRDVARGPHEVPAADYRRFLTLLLDEVTTCREVTKQTARAYAELREKADEAMRRLEREAALLVSFLATVYQDDTVILEKTEDPGYAQICIVHPAVGQLAFRVAEADLDLFPPRITRVTQWGAVDHTNDELAMRVQALAAHEWTWGGGINQPPVISPDQLAMRPF